MTSKHTRKITAIPPPIGDMTAHWRRVEVNSSDIFAAMLGATSAIIIERRELLLKVDEERKE